MLSSVNPKNLLLAVAGAVAIAGAGITTSQEVVAWIVFVAIAIASVGVGAPVVIYFAMGARAQQVLYRLKSWMVHNNAAIMAVLLLVIGTKFIGDAISGFSA